MAQYATHKLLQSLCRSEELIGRFRADPEGVCKEFGVAPAEAKALASGDPQALGAIGVHPILQIHLILSIDDEFREKMTLTNFADKLA
jgi:2'-aminobiphenyl-2,3-diol 1,2-dioxygenase small subunit